MTQCNNLSLKRGVGLFSRVDVLSGDYGNFWDNFDCFQDSRTRGQLLGVSRNSGTVDKYECGSQDTIVSVCIAVLECSWVYLHQNRMNIHCLIIIDTVTLVNI